MLGIGRSAERSLRSHAIRGSIITMGTFGCRQVIALVSNFWLASLLSPAAFGVMSLVQIALNGLVMFTDVGIGPSIIRHHGGDDPRFLNTVWTLQAVRGIGLWIMAAMLAWPLARFYGVSELIIVLPVATLSAIIGGFNSTVYFSRVRKLSWAPVNILLLIAQVVAAIAMVVAAYRLRSVWALVIGWLVQAVVVAVGSHLISGQHPHRLAWDRSIVREVMTFGRWITFSSMLTFFAAQVDRLVLARIVSVDKLGVYGLALTTVMLPSAVCGQLAQAVLFPVLSSSARERPEALSRNVLAARRVILLGSLVASLAVAFGAPILFGYIYDRRYVDAGWMAQGLSLIAWITILQKSADRTLLALGDSRSLALSYGAKCAVSVGASVGGYAVGGLVGFMGGLSIGAVAGHGVIQYSLAKQGIRIIRQDAVFTAVAVGVGAIGVLVPRLSGFPLGTREQLATLVGCGVLCGVPTAVWAYRGVAAEMFGPRSARGVLS